jgi:hypothetical protein
MVYIIPLLTCLQALIFASQHRRSGENMLAQHAAGFVVLGLALLGLFLVIAEIALKDPRLFREIATDTAAMARPSARAATARIHDFPLRGRASEQPMRKAA